MHSERGGHIIGDASPYSSSYLSPSSSSSDSKWIIGWVPWSCLVRCSSNQLYFPSIFSHQEETQESLGHTYTLTRTELGNGVRTLEKKKCHKEFVFTPNLLLSATLLKEKKHLIQSLIWAKWPSRVVVGFQKSLRSDRLHFNMFSLQSSHQIHLRDHLAVHISTTPSAIRVHIPHHAMLSAWVTPNCAGCRNEGELRGEHANCWNVNCWCTDGNKIEGRTQHSDPIFVR